MQSTEQKIKALSEAIKHQDNNEVYEYSNMLLKEFPEDVEYMQCFAISSIRMSLGEELENSLFKNAPTHQSLHQLYAYFLYNTGQYEKGIAYISSIKTNNSLKLLQAQFYFKSQKYQKSAEIMKTLIKDSKLDKEQKQQYLLNLFSTGLNQQLTVESLREYEKFLVSTSHKEIFYNYSLLMFEAKEYTKCIKYLGEFEKSLVNTVDDNDAITVKLFKDYIEWKINRNVERQNIETYQKFEKKVTDLNLKGIIQTNLMFLKNTGIEHTHDTLRMMDQWMEPQYKMTKKQKMIINLNKLSIMLKKNRIPEAQKLIKEIDQSQQSKQLMRDQQYLKNKYTLMKRGKDYQNIPQFIDSIASFNQELAFCFKADLAKQTNQEKQIIKELKTTKFTNRIIRNYIFSLLVKHESLFSEYSDYLSELVQLTQDYNVLSILLSVYESQGDKNKQKHILEKLIKLEPRNMGVKVKMAKMYLNENNIELAEELIRNVDEPEEISDIAYLQFIEKNIHISIKKQTEIKEQDHHKEPHKKRIKKKRKVRLPKNIEKIVENFKGDPERWLPKWQRKGYRKKGKKGGKTQGMATVGRQEKNVYTTGASTSAKQVTKDAIKKKK